MTLFAVTSCDLIGSYALSELVLFTRQDFATLKGTQLNSSSWDYIFWTSRRLRS